MKNIQNSELPYDLRIKNYYGELNTSEKVVADFLCISAEEVLNLKLLMLSEVLGVSEATIIRFCKNIGYSGYSELKLAIAQSIGERKVSRENNAFDINISEGDKIEELPDKVGAHVIKAMQDTLKVLDEKELKKAVKAVVKCRRLFFVGVGTSACTANDAFTKFIKLGINCVFCSDAHMQLIALANAAKGDVVIAISHSGKTKDTVDMVRVAKKRRATVICLTNYKASIIAKYSDISLLTAGYETGFHSETMISRILQLSIIDMLYLGVTLQDLNMYLKSIENTNKVLADRAY